MLMLKIVKLRACLFAAATLGLPTAARAQGALAGVTPQFPFAPAQAAPLGSQQPGPNVEWQGADNGNMAVFPDGTTTFWAFGDTFLGPNGNSTRTVLAPAVVNTVALGYVQSNGFNPYYYYRGSLTFDNNGNTTNNPSPFFMDPDRYSDSPNITPGTAKDIYSPNNVNNPFPNQGNNGAYYDANGNGPYLYNTDCSRFWTGKPIFYSSTGSTANYKLFVFLTRVDYSGALVLGNYVARVENPVNAAGGSNPPTLWNITYLKLSGVSTAGWTQPANNPQFPNAFYISGAADYLTIGAEAFLGQDAGDTEGSIYAFANVNSGTITPKTTIVKIPLSALLTAKPPQGVADISMSVKYMNKNTIQWTSSGTSDQPVPAADFLDANIPAGGGFTCRLLPGPNGTPGNTWRNVYIDAGAPQTIRLRTSTGGPFGPWSDPKTVYTIAELDSSNTPFDIFAPAVDGYNKGIYSQGMANSSGLKCYMAYEIYPFSASGQIAFTYSDDRGSVPAPYPPNCSPGSQGWFLWDNNFYRVKGATRAIPSP